MILRFLIGFFIFILSAGAFSSPTSAEESTRKDLLPYVEPNSGGVHTQPWFLNTFLNLREDSEEAASEGKKLVIFWEQKGCPYCREIHRKNLRIPEVVNYIRKNFNVVQLNLWGDKEVTDFDGEVTTEKDLAKKYRVQFTPTLQFFSDKAHLGPKKPGHDLEVWRLMGYWKPFHFLNSFAYVHEKGYVKEPSFQRWLQALSREMQAEGKEVILW
jgi:thioredoxin-related protein